MKKCFVFILALGIIFPSVSSSADTILGMVCRVYEPLSYICVAENPQKMSEIWGVNCEGVESYDREVVNPFGRTVKKFSLGSTWTCCFDDKGYFWVGGEKKLLRLKVSDTTYVVYDSLQAKALNGIVRSVKFDSVKNRIVCVSDAGVCFVNLFASGEIDGWQDFPNIAYMRGVGWPNIFFWSNEVVVVSSFVYFWSDITKEWVTNDISYWHSGVANGSAVDAEGNVYIGDDSIFKWTRSTGKWTVLPIKGGDVAFSMSINRNNVMLYQGRKNFCTVDLSKTDLVANNFSFADVGSSKDNLTPIGLNFKDDFLLVFKGKVLDFGTSASPVRFVPASRIVRESFSVVGSFDLMGRRIVNKTNFLSASGTYLAQYRGVTGKTFVSKVSSIR
jgi:hypothetical protein